MNILFPVLRFIEIVILLVFTQLLFASHYFDFALKHLLKTFVLVS